MNRIRVCYPAVFHPEEDGGYSVVIPDMGQIDCCCVTQGDDFEEANKMAFDAVGLALEDVKPENFPVPSKPENLEREKYDLVVPIIYDSYQYLQKTNTKSVRKTLTIPEWMNVLAEANHINFSKVLQNALANQLGVNINPQS